MDANMIIKLGDKVQVRVGKGRYGTIVEYVEDDATFFISPLFSMQKQISLVEGQIYTINAINKRGLFEFEVLVLETDYLGFNKNVPMTKLFMVTEPRRHQRRDAFRVGIMIDLVVREPADDDMPETEISEYHSNTLNLSESGMLFQTKKSYPPGTVLRCDLILNKYGMDRNTAWNKSRGDSGEAA